MTHQVVSADMNPTLTANELDQLRAEQSESFGSEYELSFEAGGDPLFDRSRFEPADDWAPAGPDSAAR